MNKRHAKPNAAQILSRIYRKQLAFEAAMFAEHDDQTAQYRHMKDMLETLISGQRMLSERMESFRVLADHCARLLREKETLHARLQALEKSAKIPGGRNIAYDKELDNELTRQFADGEFPHIPVGWPRPKPCAFASTHQSGIKCGVCGETPWI